jgi:hypothetical protein
MIEQRQPVYLLKRKTNSYVRTEIGPITSQTCMQSNSYIIRNLQKWSKIFEDTSTKYTSTCHSYNIFVWTILNLACFIYFCTNACICKTKLFISQSCNCCKMRKRQTIKLRHSHTASAATGSLNSASAATVRQPIDKLVEAPLRRPAGRISEDKIS